MIDENSKISVYAGTFDPITNGHIDVLKRALLVFDKIYVAIAQSTPKAVQFSVEQRIELVEEALEAEGLKGQVLVDSFDGLLVNFVREKGAVAIIRGLRAVSDYEYEAQMAHMNRRLAPDIETVFFVASEHCSFISSSIVKNVAENGGEIDGLVPDNVAARLKQIYS